MQESQKMNYQKYIFAGGVIRKAENKTSKDGKTEFTTLAASVSEGKDRRVTLPVTIFGKYGKTLAKHLTKGKQIIVEGKLSTSEGGRFNVIASKVVFVSAGKQVETQVDETAVKPEDIPSDL